MKAFEAACAVPWAIREEYLRTILAIANREIIVTTPVIPVEAVATEPFPRLAGAKTAMLANNNIAIIPVYGPILRYANFFSDISGGTSVSTLAIDFKASLENPNVKAILLDIDSPGGEVNGIEELASIIYSGRGSKPIHAYIGNEGASAAYWISSSADKIITAPTSLVGSIGVVAALPNPNVREAEQVEFVSSQSPNKRPDIRTEEGRSQIQTVVDDLAEVFITSVARNRGVSTDTVIKKFGEGGVFVGQKSVDAGLADELGSFDSAIAGLTELASKIKTNTKAEDYDMGLRADIERLLAGEVEDTKVPDAPTPIPVVTVTEPVVQPVVANNTGNVPDAEMARLKAENLQLRKTSYSAEANSIVAIAISEGRAFPSEEQILKDIYIQACVDDFNSNTQKDDGSSRVGMVTRLINSRPKHMLASESIAEKFHSILSAPSEPTSANDEPLTDDQMNRFLAMTSLGQEELAARRKGN